jgi:hypothetical protein
MVTEVNHQKLENNSEFLRMVSFFLGGLVGVQVGGIHMIRPSHVTPARFVYTI